MFLTHSEVKNIILSLKNSSPGWDNICPKVVKGSYECIIRPLTHMFNLSFIMLIVVYFLMVTYHGSYWPG